MNVLSDTIAGIATSVGNSGISIIRISGPNTFDCIDKIFRCSGPPPSKRPANTFVYGHIVSSGIKIDEVILLIYRAKKSYTREDLVEVQCHGGMIPTRKILEAIYKTGVKPAEPGEFTKRAFLNGRIDLIQAEAIADLINARSEKAASAALEQLSGSLSSEIASIYDNLINIAANMEATLDFSEDEIPDSVLLGIKNKLSDTLEDLNTLLDSWHEGHLLRQGALVVISGRPNAGKSTLLNKILGKDRAIISHIPGTTRDILEEEIILSGIPIRLVDTAGLRKSNCIIESEGIKRAEDITSKSDITIYVIDASAINNDDIEKINSLEKEKTIFILNKTDLCSRIPESLKKINYISATLNKGVGLEEIKQQLISKLQIQEPKPHGVYISERHKLLLSESSAEIKKSLEIINDTFDKDIDLATSHLRTAIESIGIITGKFYTEELLDNVFSRFCIGK